MYEKEAYVHRALSAGALGYLLKGEPSDALLEAIRVVFKGQYFLSPKMTSGVITSYSIHYTKLYDGPKDMFRYLLGRKDGRSIGVITSYSIHYTKLYERVYIYTFRTIDPKE